MFERRFRRFEPGGAGATAYMTQPLARAFDKDDLIPVPHGAAPMPVGRPGPRLLVRTLDRISAERSVRHDQAKILQRFCRDDLFPHMLCDHYKKLNRRPAQALSMCRKIFLNE